MNEVLEEIRDLLESSMSSTAIVDYYVGSVSTNRILKDQLPIICVYPNPSNSTVLVSDQLSLQRDKWQYNIYIDVMVNVFDKVSSGGVEADNILDAQKALRTLIEDRETDGTPKSTSVLGVLRRNIKGTNYLFNNDINVSYNSSNEDNKLMIIGRVEVSAITILTNRS